MIFRNIKNVPKNFVNPKNSRSNPSYKNPERMSPLNMLSTNTRTKLSHESELFKETLPEFPPLSWERILSVFAFSFYLNCFALLIIYRLLIVWFFTLTFDKDARYCRESSYFVIVSWCHFKEREKRRLISLTNEFPLKFAHFWVYWFGAWRWKRIKCIFPMSNEKLIMISTKGENNSSQMKTFEFRYEYERNVFNF